jgi:hypothetical protein
VLVVYLDLLLLVIDWPLVATMVPVAMHCFGDTDAKEF